MTTGRNDPCPCGSGKKYKKCCALRAAVAAPAAVDAGPPAAAEGAERTATTAGARARGARPAVAAPQKPRTEKRVTPPPVRRRAV